MRPDEIYWRRCPHQPEQLMIEPENCWFYPGEGPCVDGWYWWITKPVKYKTRKWIKRLPLEIWKQYGHRRHKPPSEHTDHEAMQLVVFT